MKQSKTIDKRSPLHKNLFFLILTVCIMSVSMLTAIQPLWANVPINVILPIVVLLVCKPVFFEKMKLTTLITLRIAIVFAIFIPGFRNIYVTIVLVLLVVNILEATFTDIFRYKRYFNGITGIALAVSVLFLKNEWLVISSESTSAIFGEFSHIYASNANTIWGTIAWIIAYTIWNWVFVTNEFSDSISKLHMGILASPILGCLIMGNPGFWLIFRANSLTFGGCVQISQKEFLEEELSSDKFSKFVEATKTTTAQIVLMIANLVFIAVAIFM